MTMVHKKGRVDWASTYVCYKDSERRRSIFLNEKKCNLNRLDGLHFYWHDLRKEENVLSRRQHSEGSVTIWAYFSFYGRSILVFLSGRHNSVSYCNTLQNHLLKFAALNHGIDWSFQQDNAPVNVSQLTNDWFCDKNISNIDWPVKYPDLNAIENIWGILARRLYSSGKQYTVIPSLKAAIQDEWKKLLTLYYKAWYLQ